MKNATLIEVARRANVSPSTVSRAINNGCVSAKSRKKIEAAINELNYQPNAIARSLRGARTYTVGFVIPDISNPFFTEIISEAGTLLKEKGYAMMIYSVLEDINLERMYIKNIQERRIDGLFVTSTSHQFASAYEQLDEEIPIIQVDRLISHQISSVRTDNYAASLQAVSHFFHQGRRNIGMIAGPQQYTPGRERYEGYVQALTEYHLAIDSNCVDFGDFSRDSGYECMMRILQKADSIDALLVGNNFMGVGAVQALKRAGKKIPEDLAVIMFDDMNLADMTDPPFTVMEQNLAEIGRTIASLFLERIEGKQSTAHKEIIIPARLIIRDSA